MPRKRQTKKRRSYRGGAVDLTPPAVESFGFRCGGNSPQNDAIKCKQQENFEQSKLNNQHGGSNNKNEIVIPQPSSECNSPQCANNINSNVNESFINAQSNSEYDDAVHEKKQSGGKKKRTKRKRNKRKTRKTKKYRRKKKSRRKSKK